MRRLWPLTVRGTGALVLAIACFVVANEAGLVELMYFGVLLLVVLAASVLSLWVARRSETVTRALSTDAATVGRASTVTVRVGVRSAIPTAPGTWRDVLPAGLSGRATGPFPALGSGLRGGGQTVELHYDVMGVRRGIHSVGPLTITTSDPFGLARRTVRLGGTTRVPVAPAIIDLVAPTGLVGETGGTLHTTTNQLGQGSDNLIARPYVPGDSMRRIHWRASAHRDALMVRQEEQEATPEATIVLDRGVLRWAPDALGETGADPAFETGVSMAVSALARFVYEGYSVAVVDSDGTLLADPVDGGDMVAVEAVATSFATLTARRDDSLARLPLHFAGAMTGPVVVVTGRLDEGDAEALAPLVGHTTFPLLLAVLPSHGALERAAELGWHASVVHPDGDLALAWAAATERGVTRALG